MLTQRQRDAWTNTMVCLIGLGLGWDSIIKLMEDAELEDAVKDDLHAVWEDLGVWRAVKQPAHKL